MDGFFVLLGLAALLAFVLGPIGFFVALGHGARLRGLERQIAELRELLERAEPAAAAEATVRAGAQPP